MNQFGIQPESVHYSSKISNIGLFKTGIIDESKMCPWNLEDNAPMNQLVKATGNIIKQILKKSIRVAVIGSVMNHNFFRKLIIKSK